MCLPLRKLSFWMHFDGLTGCNCLVYVLQYYMSPASDVVTSHQYSASLAMFLEILFAKLGATCTSISPESSEPDLTSHCDTLLYMCA